MKKARAKQPTKHVTSSLPPITVLNLANGETLPRLASLHGPLRTVDGDPVKAARKAVRAARAMRLETAPATVEVPARATNGPLRTNKTVPQMLEALRRAEGVTLAELTVASGWGAPVEVRNLRVMEKKSGFTLAHDGAPGAARRYRAAPGL